MARKLFTSSFGSWSGFCWDSWVIHNLSQALTAANFGHSWRYGNDVDEDCTWDCEAADPTCTDSVAKTHAEQQCAVLTDPQGKFKVWLTCWWLHAFVSTAWLWNRFCFASFVSNVSCQSIVSRCVHNEHRLWLPHIRMIIVYLRLLPVWSLSTLRTPDSQWWNSFRLNNCSQWDNTVYFDGQEIVSCLVFSREWRPQWEVGSPGLPLNKSGDVDLMHVGAPWVLCHDVRLPTCFICQNTNNLLSVFCTFI